MGEGGFTGNREEREREGEREGEGQEREGGIKAEKQRET